MIRRIGPALVVEVVEQTDEAPLFLIFAEPAGEWFAGRISDSEATDRMAAAFARLGDLWRASGRVE